MKQSSKLVLVFALALTWSSCKKGIEHTLQTESSNSIPVTLDVAKQVAAGFAKFRLGYQGDHQNREIGEIITYEGETSPTSYVINFRDKKGYVIVSGEIYEHPILGYSAVGEISKANVPCGLDAWFAVTNKEVEDIRDGLYDTKEVSTREWGALASEYDITVVNKILPPVDPPCEEGTTYIEVAPLLQTEWGQGCGYDDYCPSTSNASLCYHSPTGCVATAMAQVLKYWSAGSAFSWSSMPNTFGTTATASLMANAGASVGMSYNYSSSGAYMTAIPWGFIGGFGYGSATHMNYGLGSYSMVQGQLNAGRPVILGGFSGSSGHAWVCDGYIEGTSVWCNPDGTWAGGSTSLVFHMNWGWDGYANGYYYFGTWAPYGTGYSFSSGREAVYNIHP